MEIVKSVKKVFEFKASEQHKEQKKPKAEARAQQQRERKAAKELKEKLAAKSRATKLAMELQEYKLKSEQAAAKLEEEYQRQLLKAGEEAETLGRHFKHFVNPFTAEKSTYDQDLFQANNPFCNVTVETSINDMPRDKVSDGRLMNEKALLHAVHLLLEPIWDTKERYKKPHTELGARILHASILHNLHLLTRPSNSIPPETVTESELSSDASSVPSSSTQENVADIELSAGGTQVLFEDEKISLHESDEFLAEGDEGTDFKNLVVLDKYDLKGKVHDLNLGRGDNLVTVLIVDCDWDGTVTKIFQGSGYAMSAAISNMRKGRYSPVYIHAWSKDHWRYAVLRPTGVVTVKDGVVAIEQCAQGTVLELEALQKQLQRSTEALKEWAGAPQSYPPKEYVVGDLHVCRPEMELPMKFSNYLSEELLLFFQSLIRIFVGDYALKLSKEDIDANVAKRRQARGEDLARFTMTGHASYQSLAKRRRVR